MTAKDARSFSRYLFSGGSEVKFDPLGRITIPEFLIEHAALSKNVVVIGVLNRVEIWNKERWTKLSKDINEDSEDIAEKLSGSGV